MITVNERARTTLEIGGRVARTLVGRRADWRLDRRPHLRRPATPSVGTVIVIATFAISWFAYIGARGDGNATIALFAGASSILAMSWSMVLAVRWRAVERLFGGQDRAYVAHRWLGAVAVVGVWLHTQTADDIEGIAGAARDVERSARHLAGNAQTLLYILAAASAIRWIPTRWWRQTHKLMVLPLAIAGWHQFTSTKPFANDSFWGRWSQAIILIGLTAWLIRVVVRDTLGRGIRHRVTRLTRTPSTLTVELEPIGGRRMRHRSGQFAFVRADSLGLGEPHPFTVASHPDENIVRLGISNLGDWTGRLIDRVEPGTIMRLEGPYGGLDLGAGVDAPTMWVAGGVGITPFLAGIPALTPGSPTTLIHCFRDGDDTVGRDLTRAAASAGLLTLHEFESSSGHRFDADRLIELAGRDLSSHHVVLCGPNSLIADVRRAAEALGASRVHVDRFDLRGAIGPDLTAEVDDLVDWAQRRRQSDEPAGDQSSVSTSP